jgi:hypothetical protein
MKDLTVVLEDRPGELGKLGEATGSAGINVEGMYVTTSGGQGEIHLLVDDAAATRSALEGAGIEVGDEHDVLVVEVEDKPGTMGEVCRKLGDSGVNVEFAYTTFGGVKFVVGVDDLAKAQGAV